MRNCDLNKLFDISKLNNKKCQVEENLLNRLVE